ncbi:hypothetical protein K438DRAFT_1783143 [Mycena galopus ATCC 62051]|nr:hypothetical protein K438DRAFT_1783143 [Mycena galopus ATCC 62051]
MKRLVHAQPQIPLESQFSAPYFTSLLNLHLKLQLSGPKDTSSFEKTFQASLRAPPFKDSSSLRLQVTKKILWRLFAWGINSNSPVLARLKIFFGLSWLRKHRRKRSVIMVKKSGRPEQADRIRGSIHIRDIGNCETRLSILGHHHSSDLQSRVALLSDVIGPSANLA